MENRALRVVGSILPPWINDCFMEKVCNARGVDFQFTARILGILGYSPKYIQASTEDEAIKMLKNDSADLKMIGTYLTSNVFEVEDLGYTTVVGEDSLLFWVKDEGDSNSTHDIIFSIFHWTVWSLMFGLMASVIIVRFIYKGCSSTHQLSISKTSTKVTSTIWWFILGVCLGAYANILAIELSWPGQPRVPFNNLEELSRKLQSKQCRLVLLDSELSRHPGQDLLTTVVPIPPSRVKGETNETLERLIQAFYNNPPKYVLSMDEVFSTISNGTCYIGVDWALGRSTVEASYCGVKYIEDKHSKKMQFGFFYNKKLKSVLGEALDITLTLNSPMDIYEDIIKRESKKYEVSNCDNYKGSSHKPLKLNQMIQSFFILCTASALATVALGLEFISCKCRSKK